MVNDPIWQTVMPGSRHRTGMDVLVSCWVALARCLLVRRIGQGDGGVQMLTVARWRDEARDVGGEV